MSDNPARLLNRPHVKRPDDISSTMQFSILLSMTLDVMGYNQDMIKHRVEFWTLKEPLDNIHFDAEVIYAGSQKEGTVAVYGSDMDLMEVIKNVICADNHQSYMDHRNITLFQTDNHNIEPGYTKLKLIKIGNAKPVIKESLFISSDDDTYISSDFVTNYLMVECREHNKNNNANNASLSKAGPAVPVCRPYSTGVVDDLVLSFKCYCPALLRSWLRRPRRYNWPTRNILQEISQMEAHVVPVGCKGSETYYQEWRICFTKAEIHLIHSLNDTQVKLYIILKMVAKSILKKICPELTSYLIKNIVLWMCEYFPSGHFTEHQLACWTIQALSFLKKCVMENYLPSYMIPERNLLHGRIENEQKRELIDYLSSLLGTGFQATLSRLDKIRDTMCVVYQEPAKAEFFRIKRNLIETLNLLKLFRYRLISRGMTMAASSQFRTQDALYLNIERALVNLVVPEWTEQENISTLDILDIFKERLRKNLS